MFAFLACTLASSTPAQPIELVSIGTMAELAAHVERPARLTGYLDVYQTPMWGGRHLAVKAGHQLFLLDADDEEAAQLEPHLGTTVTLGGELGLQLVGPTEFYAEAVGRDRDHLTDPTGEHAEWERVVFSFDVETVGPVEGAGDVGTDLGLDQVLTAGAPVELRGTLLDRLFPGPHPALVVELDGRLVGVRVVVEAADQLRALAGSEVVLTGTVTAAEPSERLVLEPREGDYDLEHRVGLVVQVQEFGPA